MNTTSNYTTSNYGANQTSGSVPATLPASVGGTLTGVEQSVNVLHASIDKLIDRLTAVLGPVRPSTDASSPAPQPNYSPLVLGLRAQGFKIDGATMRLDELMSRIEL